MRAESKETIEKRFSKVKSRKSFEKEEFGKCRVEEAEV